MNKQLGIIGCGQLAQMLGQAAKRLELDVCFLCIDETPVVQGIGPIFNENEIDDFIEQADFVTVEREAIPEDTLRRVEQRVPLSPRFNALQELRSRHSQKALLDKLEIPTATWRYVEKPEGLKAAIAAFSEDGIRCKQTLGGYDGGGQWRLTKADINAEIPAQGFPLIMEAEINVDEEVSILIARSGDGNVVFYPISENHMSDGVLTWSFTPAELENNLTTQIRDYAQRLVEAIDYVGLLAIEFFLSDGKLLVNEIAPRVHNTGHWTLDTSNCDQFEQHVRAVASLPLIKPELHEAAGMCNLLGDMLPKALPDNPVRMYLHSYGKSLRPGRKMGHLTLVGPDLKSVRSAAKGIGLD